MENATSVTLSFASARNLPDPFKEGVSTYWFRVDTRTLPELPTDANARPSDAAKTRRVYKSLRNSALDGALDLDEACTPSLFGIKNLGINVIAAGVKKVDDHTSILYFRRGQGVMNGGHTADILYQLQQKPGVAEMPPNYVNVFVTVGLDDDVIPEVAGANNTSVQVKPQSLLDLEHAFDPIKDALEGSLIANNIQWREGEDGDVKADDIVATMTCFRSDVYPPESGDSSIGKKRRTPHNAYAYKTGLIDDFRKDLPGYHVLAPTLPEILKFKDYIRTQPRQMYNEAGGRFGALKFVDSIYTNAKGEKRKNPLDAFEMPFTGEKVEYRLNIAAVYPILAAFRLLIRRKTDSDGDRFEWVMPFENVKALWDEISVSVVEATRDNCAANNYNLNALGKSRPHWDRIEGIVENAVLRHQLKASQAEVAATKS